jgi:hypothetical protein
LISARTQQVEPQYLPHHVRSGRDKPRRIALCAITHSSTNTLPFPPSILECEIILQLDIFSKTSTWGHYWLP